MARMRMSSKEDDHVRHELISNPAIVNYSPATIANHGVQKSVQKIQFSIDRNNVVGIPVNKLHELKKRISQVSKQYLHTNFLHTNNNNLCNYKCTALPSYFNLTFSVSKAALTIFCICMKL